MSQNSETGVFTYIRYAGFAVLALLVVLVALCVWDVVEVLGVKVISLLLMVAPKGGHLEHVVTNYQPMRYVSMAVGAFTGLGLFVVLRRLFRFVVR